MNKFILSVLLVVVMAAPAFGMGWMGGGGGGGNNNPGPVVKTNNNNGNQSANGPINSNGVAGAMASDNAAFNRTDDPGSNRHDPVSVPEPDTIFLLGGALVGLAVGFATIRRTFSFSQK